MKDRAKLSIIVILAAILLPVLAAAQQQASRIAIFSEPGFPYVCAPNISGPEMQAWFGQLNVKADLVDADALADPNSFNADRYAVLLDLYGNAFPEAAAENLRTFHQHGGGLVAAGVPFCHPCQQRTGAAGWNWIAGPKDVVGVTAEAAHTGAVGVKITKNSPQWSGIQLATRIPAKPGEQFTLGGWAKTQYVNGSRDRNQLLLRCWDAGGAFLGQAGPDLPISGGDWQFVSSGMVTPPRTAAVDVILAMVKPKTTVWLDDVVLVQGNITAHAKNLLPNPSFEQHGASWQDLGHIPYYDHNNLGTGAFYSAGKGTDLTYHAKADPLGLAVLDWPLWRRLYLTGKVQLTQGLDPKSLPQSDKVISIVDWTDAKGTWPAIAIIRHGCPQFPGAIDVWAGAELFSAGHMQSVLAQEEVYGRAALYILHEKGELPDYADLLKRADGVFKASLPPGGLTLAAGPPQGHAVPDQQNGPSKPYAGKPIPCGPNAPLGKALPPHYLDFCRKFTVEAYQQHGKHDPSWDAPAKKFLEAYAERMAGTDKAPDMSALLKMGQGLLAKHCDDPLILDRIGQLNLSMKNMLQASKLISGCIAGLKAQGYPALCLALAYREMAEMSGETGTDPGSTDFKWRPLAMAAYADACDRANFGPEQQRWMWIALEDALDTWFPTDRDELTKALAARPNTDPWLLDMARGLTFYDTAWFWLQQGWGSQGASLDSQTFDEAAQKAYKQFLAAYKVQPDYPESCGYLLNIANMAGIRSGGSERDWFDRGVAAQFDYIPLYDNMLWALLPIWGGSHAAMLAFGKECVDTGRFDTEVPWEYDQAVDMISNWDQDTEIYTQGDVWPTLQRMLKGYLAYDTKNDPKSVLGLRANWAQLAREAGDKAEAKRQENLLMKAIPPPTPPTPPKP